jgi:hypothetical protein
MDFLNVYCAVASLSGLADRAYGWPTRRGQVADAITLLEAGKLAALVR